MAEHPIQGLMGVTIEKIRDMVNAETIIGDPIHVDDTTIIPVSRVTFGFASGGSDVGPSSNKQMFGGGSGAGVSVTPVAFLVVSNGNVRTVQLVEKVSAVDNVIASLPELVDKVAALIKKEKPGADDQGICSRREAERLIAAGKVKVNGHPVTLGDKMDPDYDKVMIDGQTQRIVRKRQYTYIMLHKPRGYLTTRSDDRGRKTVMDLVSDVPAMLRPVGRLDKDSEGLLLMTDDGAFINMLTHPSGGVGKLYRVTVNPRATEQQIIEMSSGVVLDDGVKTKPCVIHVVVDEPGRSVLEITLHEGRNRQIRRMCSAVGLQVVRLRRSAEGPVKLGMLQPGEYRELKKSEINALRNAAMKSAGKGESRAASPARRPGPLKKRTNSD